MSDLISRKAAIDALWKALFEYEDKTEKQFQETDDLDIGEWMVHRIFVQNMSDIDRQTIQDLPSAEPEEDTIEMQEADIDETMKRLRDARVTILPSAEPEIIRCKDCKHNPKYEWFGCPMSHLSEAQRPETAWCWKAERRTDAETEV